MREPLTESEWLQIEQAAHGCISGTSDDWPELRRVIAKITGRTFKYRQSADWMRGFCWGVLSGVTRDD